MTSEPDRGGLPALYTELASWWPLLSDPADYAGEAEEARRLLTGACETPPVALLELGSGGGNNASHLKAHFRMTLVDLSPGMLEVSRRLNPECEHVEGDMRSIRLERRFDAVFVHDAVNYMTAPDELRAAIATAAAHCRPGGAALFVPDFVRESFASIASMGGHDGGGRSLRYLQWIHDPEPGATTYRTDFAVFLKEAGGSTRLVHDRHVSGLFARAEWLALLEEAGFEARALTDAEHREVFIGKK
jgi:SAM-dependent methyltransferase